MDKYSDEYLISLYQECGEIIDNNEIDSGKSYYQALIEMWDNYFNDKSYHLHGYMVDRLFGIIQKELATRFIKLH